MTSFARPQRFILLATGLLTMLLALWAGLIRTGWVLPPLFPTLPAGHGPLMVSGFLGTLVGLERAVALNTRWAYGAPLLTALGAVSILAGLPDWVGALLITAGSAVVVSIFTVIVQRQPELFNQVLRGAASVWLLGNLIWLTGREVSEVVLWWMAFLVLTIAGERLELNRLLQPSVLSRRAFLAATALLTLGPAVALVRQDLGWRLTGVGMVALALWLLINDIARRTVRQQGLTRYIAICLLTGYVWLGVGGALALLVSVQRLYAYDAILHSVFLGFVFAMIFGHAPVIFPAVVGIAIPMRKAFYAHLVLLHLSLALRVGADLAQWVPLRRWGAMLNGIALLLFLANTMLSALRARRTAARTAS